MPKKLSRTEREKLAKQEIKAALLSAKIKDGYIKYESIPFLSIDKIKRSDAYSHLIDWKSIVEFFYEALNEYARENKQVEAVDNKTAELIASKIHQKLKDVPKKYHFIMPLPEKMVLAKTLRLDDSVNIININEGFNEEYTKANPEQKEKQISLIEALATGRLGINAPKLDASVYYLQVKTRGYVKDQDCRLIEHDPIYLYKVLFSLFMVKGLMQHAQLRKIGSNYSYKIIALHDDLKYETTLNRPEDEKRLIEGFAFKSRLEATHVIKTFREFQLLVKPQHKPEVEKLRNKIMNSLYWYFEKSKNQNYQLKHVFLISAFDAFFDTDEMRNIKARLIANDSANTVQSIQRYEEEIIELYKRRNSVIHGEKPMLEYNFHKSVKDDEGDFRTDTFCSAIYDRYIQKKINVYMSSVLVAK